MRLDNNQWSFKDKLCTLLAELKTMTSFCTNCPLSRLLTTKFGKLLMMLWWENLVVIPVMADVKGYKCWSQDEKWHSQSGNPDEHRTRNGNDRHGTEIFLIPQPDARTQSSHEVSFIFLVYLHKCRNHFSLFQFVICLGKLETKWH